MKRDDSSANIIAITGSAGKTSLKNMVHQILSNYDKTYASPKSFNNHFGVPISLSNLDLGHRYGVFEVGMSKTGEIDKLSKLLRPHLAIITNIAEAHIENFKNLKGIAKAKSEIIKNIVDNGTVILNRDDKFYHYLKKKAQLNKIKVTSFGKSKFADIRLLKIKKNYNQTKAFISIEEKKYQLQINDNNIYNVLAALAVVKVLNLNIKRILNRFSNLQPTDGRGKLHTIKRYNKRFRLIDESYNANPLSVKTALNTFSSIKKDKFKKYLLLGDMLELGKRSKIYHMELSKLINRSDIDKVFIKGEKSLFTYKKVKKDKRGNIIQCFEDVDLVLKNIIANNDYLMIKGSNATGLKFISNVMKKGL